MDLDYEVVAPFIQAYLSQVSSAMKISDVLAKHDNSDEITPDHLIGGLVYRLMVSMTETELHESIDTAKEIMDKLEHTDSEESGSDDDYDDYDELDECYDISNDTIVPRKLKPPSCNCDICSHLRVCLLNYKDYECSDELAQRFKDSIDVACEKHKIYI